MDIRNFEVLVENLEDNPHCLHGPTLVFRKNTKNTKDYYACSACRDRKSCSFYLPVLVKKEILIKTSNFWKKEQKSILLSLKKSKPREKFIEILNATKNLGNNNDENVLIKSEKNSKLQTGYCYSCCCFFLKNECKKHQSCHFLSNPTLYQLHHPTLIVYPMVDNSNHAQYFFSESAVKDILLLLSRLKIFKVLCIGVPRIHEQILYEYKSKIKSLLLDFDKNYYNFYAENEFIWYNMFNNYIFDEKQHEVLNNFLQSKKILVLIDPPFGGRVEPLARTLNLLNKTFTEVNKIKHTKVMVLTFYIQLHVVFKTIEQYGC